MKQFFSLGENISGSNYFYTLDHLGSVREMTNTSGAVQSAFSYDPFGRPTQIAGTGAVPDKGFCGYYLHQRSGLSLTRTRAYNASLGRFISRDPIGEAGGINMYAYVASNPISFRDPLGLDRAAPIPGPFGPYDPKGPPPFTNPKQPNQGPCFKYAVGKGGNYAPPYNGPPYIGIPVNFGAVQPPYIVGPQPPVGQPAMIPNPQAGAVDPNTIVHSGVGTGFDENGQINRIQDIMGNGETVSHQPFDPAFNPAIYGSPVGLGQYDSSGGRSYDNPSAGVMNPGDPTNVPYIAPK